MIFAIGLNETLMFVFELHSGWKTGDLHFVVFDIFHEQPPDIFDHNGDMFGVFGVKVGLFGYYFAIGIRYEKI